MNALTPQLEIDIEGKLIAYETPQFKLNTAEIYNLLRPFVVTGVQQHFPDKM